MEKLKNQFCQKNTHNTCCSQYMLIKYCLSISQPGKYFLLHFYQWIFGKQALRKRRRNGNLHSPLFSSLICFVSKIKRQSLQRKESQMGVGGSGGWGSKGKQVGEVLSQAVQKKKHFTFLRGKELFCSKNDSKQSN